MGFYKKFNKFGRVMWVAALDECTDPEAIEISEQEYNLHINTNDFDDIEIHGE